MVSESVLDAFGLSGDVATLPGGSGYAYRVGDVVLKQFEETTLETEHSLELAPWLFPVLHNVEHGNFRLAKPIQTNENRWIAKGGWTAWTAISGRPAKSSEVPVAILAIQSLHERISGVAKHPLLDQNTTAWGVAHHNCWQDKLSWVHPEIEPLLDALYARLKPLPDAQSQLIHGDLHPGNILIARGEHPGIVDFTPFWSPPNFALAIFANFIGPRRGNTDALRHFGNIPEFGQLLLRAAIRMLLVVSELRGVENWRSERRAAELVLGIM